MPDYIPLPQTAPALIDRPDFRLELEKLKYYREEVRHDFNLLTGRVGSYITSQSFLVVAYAAAMTSDESSVSTFALGFSIILVILGIVLSVLAAPGITGASKVIKLWLDREKEVFKMGSPDPERLDQALKSFTDGRPNVDPIHPRSLLFAKLVPWIFGIAWVFFLALSCGIALYARSG